MELSLARRRFVVRPRINDDDVFPISELQFYEDPLLSNIYGPPNLGARSRIKSLRSHA